MRSKNFLAASILATLGLSAGYAVAGGDPELDAELLAERMAEITASEGVVSVGDEAVESQSDSDHLESGMEEVVVTSSYNDEPEVVVDELMQEAQSPVVVASLQSDSKEINDDIESEVAESLEQEMQEDIESEVEQDVQEDIDLGLIEIIVEDVLDLLGDVVNELL